jgi:hypothetical protein
MTDTTVRPAEVAGALPAHPLDPATGAEYLAGRQILARAGLLGDSVRFAYYGLEEPPKDQMRAGAPGRRLRAFLIDVATGQSADVVVSLDEDRVASRRVLDPRADGRVPIISEDFAVAEEVVRADPGWRAAMARRGLTDVSKIRACPLTAGSFGVAGEDGRRMVRVLAFRQEREHDYVWAHPVDGIAAYVDLIERKVFEIVDEFELPVPDESGDYDDPAVRGPLREGLRPIEITQPEGPSFTLDGHLLRWQGWSMRIGFDAREGLVLHQVSLDDGGRTRPVIYRASVPEMVVPYGDPRFRYWQTYFDTGEYLLGKWANALERGCDCLGEIAYLDATVTDDFGAPQVIRNAICVHEEDVGILWKHTDIFNGSAQTRRQRRLVVSSWSTVGNYDYGFYWYFYLDGTIEHEVKLTAQRCRRLREPAPGRGGAAGVRRRRPGHRRRGHRAVAHVRADALPAAGGLAGDAGGPVRVRAEAHGVLQPEPRARRPSPARRALLRPFSLPSPRASATMASCPQVCGRSAGRPWPQPTRSISGSSRISASGSGAACSPRGRGCRRGTRSSPGTASGRPPPSMRCRSWRPRASSRPGRGPGPTSGRCRPPATWITTGSSSPARRSASTRRLRTARAPRAACPGSTRPPGCSRRRTSRGGWAWSPASTGW